MAKNKGIPLDCFIPVSEYYIPDGQLRHSAFAAVYKQDVQLLSPDRDPHEKLDPRLASGTIVATALRRNPERNPHTERFE